MSISRRNVLATGAAAITTAASSALWNFARSREIPCEFDTGLQWISRQIDLLIVELRQNWDAANPEKEDTSPLKAVED